MSKLVMIAEDDGDILNLVRAVLEDSGFRVAATTGADTIAQVREHRPDLLLLDYQMPGMDGVQVAQELRNDSTTRDIPIIAMTAAGRAPTVCHEMDANGWLGKPFDIDHLVDVVEQMTHTTH